MLYRKVVQSYSCWTPFFQKFLSTVENAEISVKKRTKKKSPKQNILTTDEIRHTLSYHDLDHYVDILPISMIRRRSNICTGLYFVNKDSAKLFCSMISKELLKNKPFVVESNPGFGFLTEELLSTGIYPIHLYEKCDKFIEAESPLSKLLLQHKNKLQIKYLNVYRMWMNLLRDKLFNDTLGEVYLEDAPHRDWEEDSYIQLITVSENRTLLALIVHNFFNQTSLFEYGRPSFYIAIPSYIWKRLTVDNTNPDNYRFYSQFNVMLYLFFDHKCFGTLPRNSFIPWSSRKIIENNEDMDDSMIVLQLEPKIKTFDIITKEDLRPFWFFLKYCMRSKNIRVIKEFEKLVPGCGPKLIQQNIDVFTIFKELDPNKLLHLFHTFKSWPEYCESSFMPSKAIKKDEEEELEQELNELDLPLSNEELVKQ